MKALTGFTDNPACIAACALRPRQPLTQRCPIGSRGKSHRRSGRGERVNGRQVLLSWQAIKHLKRSTCASTQTVCKATTPRGRSHTLQASEAIAVRALGIGERYIVVQGSGRALRALGAQECEDHAESTHSVMILNMRWALMPQVGPLNDGSDCRCFILACGDPGPHERKQPQDIVAMAR